MHRWCPVMLNALSKSFTCSLILILILSVPTATLQVARLCQECAEVGVRPTHWWCPVLLNALCKSLTCKFSISISISS